MDIGKKLKEIRQENNYIQATVADALNVSRVAYNRYENNKREISIQLLIVLADFYNVSLDYLCGRDFK